MSASSVGRSSGVIDFSGEIVNDVEMYSVLQKLIDDEPVLKINLSGARFVSYSPEAIFYSQDGFTDRVGKVLASALRQNSTLKSLDLSKNNKFTEATMAAFAETLKTNSTLTELSIDGLHTTKSGREISKLLRRNRSMPSRVRSLSFDHTGKI